jgi:hypothetical protein
MIEVDKAENKKRFGEDFDEVSRPSLIDRTMPSNAAASAWYAGDARRMVSIVRSTMP